MSEQVEFLRNLILSTERGNYAGEVMLRDILVAAVQAAPTNDLVKIAKAVVNIGNPEPQKEKL